MLLKNIKKVAVIGVGYVGLPITVELAKNNKFEIIGFDSNKNRVDDLNNGLDVNNEINVNRGDFKGELIFTSNDTYLENSNIFIVTVQPIDSTNKPDLTALTNAAKTIGQVY